MSERVPHIGRAIRFYGCGVYGRPFLIQSDGLFNPLPQKKTLFFLEMLITSSSLTHGIVVTTALRLTFSEGISFDHFFQVIITVHFAKHISR